MIIDGTCTCEYHPQVLLYLQKPLQSHSLKNSCYKRPHTEMNICSSQQRLMLILIKYPFFLSAIRIQNSLPTERTVQKIMVQLSLIPTTPSYKGHVKKASPVKVGNHYLHYHLNQLKSVEKFQTSYDLNKYHFLFPLQCMYIYTSHYYQY